MIELNPGERAHLDQVIQSQEGYLRLARIDLQRLRQEGWDDQQLMHWMVGKLILDLEFVPEPGSRSGDLAGMVAFLLVRESRTAAE